MTPETIHHTITQKNLFERYKRIQNVCDSLLERMEGYFDQNLILEDPKELLRLETLLKVRSKLLDFEREIRTEHDSIKSQTFQEKQQTREYLIKDIIKKIKQATGK
jgi:hypothetical protein